MARHLETLSAAQSGDAAAFGQLVRPYENELKAYCYRMSGSLHDAEDLLQDSLLRAWRGLARFEGRSSIRTWLYRVASSACLDALEHKKSRSLPSGQGSPSQPGQPIEPLLEPIWLEPCPDQLVADSTPSPEARYSARESIELAFMTALQRLSPKGRAVLILRDVLGWDAASCAELLETSPTAINSALIRAREVMNEARPGPAAVLEPSRSLLSRYVQAWETSNVTELVSLLREDAVLSMPPFAAWFVGPEAIGASIKGMVLPEGSQGSFKLVQTHANNTGAFMAYRKTPAGRFEASGVHVLQLADGKIAALHAFLDPSLAKPFGFNATL
jgi:RNA polymerase sigma-70 factor (ECF subfamily)